MISRKRQEELINQLAEICAELDWLVAIPGNEGDTETVDGLIIGNEEYVMNILQALDPETQNNVEVFSMNESEEMQEPVTFDAKTKKKVTMH